MKQYIALLGLPVKDLVTESEGIVTSVCFDLYGCVQLLVSSKLDSDGKHQNSRWFDVTRMEVLDDMPVMPVPDFDAPVAKGPAAKPTP